MVAKTTTIKRINRESEKQFTKSQSYRKSVFNNIKYGNIVTRSIDHFIRLVKTIACSIIIAVNIQYTYSM